FSSSIETQKKYLSRHARLLGLTKVKYYIDDGYSGTTFDRPAFKELIDDIESKKIDNILVKDLSRLGRNYLTTGYYIEHYFPINNVRFIAINDQVDSINKQNDFMPFKNIMNEWYARDISRKIKSAYRTKALNGEFTGSSAPYGYEKDPKNKNHLVINEEKAKVVRLIYEMYINGKTIYNIIKYLKSHMISTPRAETNKLTNKYNLKLTKKYPYDWNYKTIQSILSNEEYTGKLVCNKHTTLSYKNKKLLLNPKEKWIVIKDTHEAIISEETYMNAQLVMKSRYRKKATKNKHLFMGMIRCGNCGRTLTYSIDKRRKGRGVYVCSTYRVHGLARCTSHYIRYDKICSYVLSQIETLKHQANTNRKNLFKDIYNKKISEIKVDEFNESNSDDLNERLITIKKVFTQLYEDYALEKITNDDYFHLKEQYQIEKEEIEELINKKASISMRKEKLSKDIYDFIDNIKSMKIGSELSIENINLLIEKIVISENKGKKSSKSICIYYKNIGII
ncbi:MAG: recombinase family protein, partial [Sphaerochaetaceae bacterium]|nr:recombinase family protein [Sphaerochaetaceae bacterium]